MAYFKVKRRGSSVVTRTTTLGNRDFSPDMGGKSPHFANCRLIQDGGAGAYSSKWECDKLDPTYILVPDRGGKLPNPDCALSKSNVTDTWNGSSRMTFKEYACKYGNVVRNVTADEKVNLEQACASLGQGQQGEPVWVHKDELLPTPGSPTDRYLAYPSGLAFVTAGNLKLQCKYANPLPDKEATYQQKVTDFRRTKGERDITEAEVDKYKELCTPFMSSTGIEIPRKPVWKKTITKPRPNDKKLGVVEGQHELRCVLDTSGIEFVIDPTLTKLQQQEALALQAQQASQDTATSEAEGQELQQYLQQGEEAATPWYVRYKVPLILLGGMVAIGGGAAIVQRLMSGKKAPVVPAKNVGRQYTRRKHGHELDGSPSVVTELCLDKYGEVDHERVFLVLASGRKTLIGRILETPGHPFGHMAVTKLGRKTQYGRRNYLIDWLVSQSKELTKNIGKPYMRRKIPKERWSVTIEFLHDGNWEYDNIIRAIGKKLKGEDIGSGTDVMSWMRDIEFHFKTFDDAKIFAEVAGREIRMAGARKVKTVVSKV